jgi:hypothetical protein
MALADRGDGPFQAQAYENTSTVAVIDRSGEQFCLVYARDCAGKDKAGAKARAERIAESLNKTEGHAR